MLFKFPNTTLVAMFIGAVMERFSKDIHEWDFTHPTEIEPNDTLVEVRMVDSEFRVRAVRGGKADVTIRTLEDMEVAIGKAVALAVLSPATLSASQQLHITDGSKGNNSGYDCTFFGDGRVQIGCQKHSKEDAEKIIAFAKAVVDGKTPKPFPTSNSRYVARRGPNSVSVSGEGIKASHIVALAAVRERWFANNKPKQSKKLAAPKPVRLFSK